MAESQRRPTPPNLLTLDQAAPLVPCAVGSLKTPSFRRRLGLPFYQIGGRIFIDPEDIVRWRQTRRVIPEQVPA